MRLDDWNDSIVWRTGAAIIGGVTLQWHGVPEPMQLLFRAISVDVVLGAVAAKSAFSFKKLVLGFFLRICLIPMMAGSVDAACMAGHVPLAGDLFLSVATVALFGRSIRSYSLIKLPGSDWLEKLFEQLNRLSKLSEPLTQEVVSRKLEEQKQAGQKAS